MRSPVIDFSGPQARRYVAHVGYILGVQCLHKAGGILAGDQYEVRRLSAQPAPQHLRLGMLTVRDALRRKHQNCAIRIRERNGEQIYRSFVTSFVRGHSSAHRGRTPVSARAGHRPAPRSVPTSRGREPQWHRSARHWPRGRCRTLRPRPAAGREQRGQRGQHRDGERTGSHDGASLLCLQVSDQRLVVVDLFQSLSDRSRGDGHRAVDFIVKTKISAETFDVAVENGADNVALRIDHG